MKIIISFWINSLLYTLLPYICYCFHTFNHHTFYFETFHYDITPQYITRDENNQTIVSIIDHYNNSIIFNSSLIITINNEIVIDYLNDNDWNEIYYQSNNVENNNNHYHNIKNRRRLWGIFRKLGNWIKRLFGKLAIPPPRYDRYWRKSWIKRSRYIGYFPGYRHQKGLPYKKAEKYCNEHYGGLATINSKQENQMVYGICRQLLKKYKVHRVCKRRCKYILFRGTKCWTECKIPKKQRLYAKKHWKGHNCWIGLQLGSSVEKGKAFSKWNDMRKVRYKNWSPGEPNYRTKKRCKRIWGNGGGEKTCETQIIYDEKCAEMYAWKAGHIIVKRSPKENKLFKGLPPDVAQSLSPKPQGMFKRIEKASKWNNAPCKFSRVPICQKPRGQVYDKYIAVRASRSYHIAAQYCSDWYGSTLATIESDEDARLAMEACQAIDVTKRSCWIGLQRPFSKWDDGTDSEVFNNWAPGEPNNAGYNENCAEMYAGNGKWNDLGCTAKRYFLCNAMTVLQRMDTNIRKKMILKRLRRHKDKWQRYRRAEYRAKIRKQYREKMMKHIRKMKMLQRQAMQKQREMMRQRAFTSQYGKFMGKLGMGSPTQMDHINRFSNQGIGNFPAKGGMIPYNSDRYSMWTGKQNGWVEFGMMRRRRLMFMDDEMFVDDNNYYTQNMIDKIHDDNNNDNKMPRKRRQKLNKNIDEYMEIDTFGIGDYQQYDKEEDAMDAKCTFFSSFYGLFEMCINSKGIDIKKYITNTIKKYNDSQTNILNDSNISSNVNDEQYGYLNYMEYEDLKYRLAMKYDNITSLIVDDTNIDEIGSLIESHDEIDSYHLKLTNFVYDFDSSHNKQCWKYLYEFEICLQRDDDDMMLEISKSNLNIILPTKSIHFKHDSEWNEINLIDGNIIKKCIHYFDAKICIECKTEIETTSLEIIDLFNASNLNCVSYITSVLIQDDEDELSQQESLSYFE